MKESTFIRRFTKLRADDRPDWARRIAECRLGTGLSQAALAAKLGMAQSTLASYERGQNEPSLGVLEKLASSLNTSAAFLAFGFSYLQPMSSLAKFMTPENMQLLACCFSITIRALDELEVLEFYTDKTQQAVFESGNTALLGNALFWLVDNVYTTALSHLGEDELERAADKGLQHVVSAAFSEQALLEAQRAYSQLKRKTRLTS